VNKKKRVLFVKIGAIGDVLMATPALNAYKKKYPDSHITWLVGKWSSSVLKFNSAIDELYEVEDCIFYQKRLSGLAKLLLQLRKERFDQVVLLHRNLLYYFYFYLGCKNILSFATEQLPIAKEGPQFKDGYHHIFNYIGLVDSDCTLDEDSAQMSFPIDSSIEEQLKEKLKNLKVNKLEDLIILNPGGGSNPGESVSVRQWGTEKYIELLDRLLVVAPESTVVLSGGPTDSQLCEQIFLAHPNKKIINLTGKLTLGEFRCFLEKALLFITGDTGGMHMAAAVGVPVLSLFGPTDPYEKAPIGKKHRFVWNGKVEGQVHSSLILPSPHCHSEIDCAPCYHGKFKGCDCPRCMDSISVGQVIDTIKIMLNRVG
jgi:ADP-heptose:LPS heptosyltransferase